MHSAPQKGQIHAIESSSSDILFFIYLLTICNKTLKHTLASLKYMQLVDCKSGHYHC